MSFHHSYWGLRHGESIPNTKKLIVSDISEGALEQNGLSPLGISQANSLDLIPLLDELSNSNDNNSNNNKNKICIFTSDFSRAIQTAEIIQKRLQSEEEIDIEFHTSPALRERFFGDFEGKSNYYYETVWENDKTQAANFDVKTGEFCQPNCQNFRGTEGVENVYKRVVDLIRSIEKIQEKMYVILVSHGDALQILQCYFHNQNPYLHRSLPHLETCELRKFA